MAGVPDGARGTTGAQRQWGEIRSLDAWLVNWRFVPIETGLHCQWGLPVRVEAGWRWTIREQILFATPGEGETLQPSCHSRTRCPPLPRLSRNPIGSRSRPTNLRSSLLTI